MPLPLKSTKCNVSYDIIFMVLLLTKVRLEVILPRRDAVFAPIGSSADVRKNAHERLGELLCELKSVLLRYPTINTIDILTMAALLITKIKSRSLCIHVGVSALLSAKYEWTLDKISASLRCHLKYSLSGMAILFKTVLNSTVDVCYYTLFN